MHDDVRGKIAAEIRAEMARKRMTQRDLADKLGIAQPAVQLRLSGQRPFRAEELVVIAAALGVEPGQFLPAPAASAA
ncbi:helix-turn-helix domain-containing protein [Micromonospora chalcea]|uniref:helix-turn-helix domain-containing protein n=1 Tax=Micromonospora chalcea TaxID=1874 RepID=UPI0021A7B8CA|nr:helix-turn-helix transcriptional regulator [Micromonospora chalcea]MCT2282590.1 helix-turn-helix domain-containing protein [Micromonospora chalcea]